jgi:hypothetical protein
MPSDEIKDYLVAVDAYTQVTNMEWLSRTDILFPSRSLCWLRLRAGQAEAALEDVKACRPDLGESLLQGSLLQVCM